MYASNIRILKYYGDNMQADGGQKRTTRHLCQSEMILLCSFQMSRRSNHVQNYDLIQKILLEDIPSGSEIEFSDDGSDFDPENHKKSGKHYYVSTCTEYYVFRCHTIDGLHIHNVSISYI